MTGAAAGLAASPAAGAAGEFPGVLDGVLLDGPAARLAEMLDKAFLTEAGWDPAAGIPPCPGQERLIQHRGQAGGRSLEQNPVQHAGELAAGIRGW